MVGARCSRLLLLAALLLLLLLSAAAPAAGIGLRVGSNLAPKVRAPDLAVEEGSGDAEEAGAENTTAMIDTKQDEADNKILDANVPDTTQAFFNYGMAFALLTYITMGIGYFFGPYSVDAYLANVRSEHRIEHLKEKLNLTDEQMAEAGEHDYGAFVEEEATSILDNSGYRYGGYEETYQEQDGVYGQDSYTTYEGQISRRRGSAAAAAAWGGQPPRVARVEPAGRRWRAENRRGRPYGAGRNQQRRPQPTGQRRRQPQQHGHQADRRRQPQQDVLDRRAEQQGGTFKIYRQPQPAAAPQRPLAPAEAGAPSVQPAGGYDGPVADRETEPAGRQPPRPAPYPTPRHRQPQRRPVYRPSAAPRPAVGGQRRRSDGHQPAPENAEYHRAGYPSEPAAAPGQGVPAGAAGQHRSVAPAGDERRGAVDTAGAPSSAGGAEPARTDRRHVADSRVDLVELVAAVDTTHAECRAWIRCLQNSRHPQAPGRGRRGRREDDDCSRYINTCPAKRPAP